MSVRQFWHDLRSPELHTFTRVWVGQLVSMMGTALTMGAALVVVYADRLYRRRLTATLGRLAAIIARARIVGSAVPVA